MNPPARTRRERLREATIEDIKEAALVQIAEVGAPTLSLRGVARAIGMSPAGLYRYYDGRDGLLTDLIADAYNDLADAVWDGIAAVDTESVTDRFTAGVMAYRRWALDHPNRFLLIFGTPIPGYAAPEGGPTVEANRRIGEAFFRLAAEAWSAGLLEPPPPEREPTTDEEELAGLLGVSGFPAVLVPALIGAWAHFHGLVSLEVLNQLDWLYPDDREPFIRGEIARMLRSLGL